QNSVASPPPCGGGLGVGVVIVRRCPCDTAPPPPRPPSAGDPPHKGEGKDRARGLSGRPHHQLPPPATGAERGCRSVFGKEMVPVAWSVRGADLRGASSSGAKSSTAMAAATAEAAARRFSASASGSKVCARAL